MELRIGINNSPREIILETSATAAELTKYVEESWAKDTAVLKFVDSKGKVTLVPKSAISYVELSQEESRRIGFVS